MALAIGEKIGPFTLLSELGRGGMGVVYLARDPDNKRFAIKTLRSNTPINLDAFRREIAVTKLLEHPGVVRLVDSGVRDGAPWYAMQLLEGRPLSEYMYSVMGGQVGAATASQAPPPIISDTVAEQLSSPDRTPHRTEPNIKLNDKTTPESAIDLDIEPRQRTLLGWIGEVCQTLAYMHGKGLVHCDLKPANIFITNQRAMLIDFGLTIRLRGRMGPDSLLNAGLAAGTAQYTCPERAQGQEVDARADLYAIGCILFEILTGRAPFPSEDAGRILYDQVNKPPPRPSSLGVELPERLEALIMALLEKEPRNRPGHAHVVVRVLQDCGIDTGPEEVLDPSPYLFQARFVGREVLLDRTRSRLKAAMMGRGGTLLLVGASGAGKTRVAVELVRQMRHRIYKVLHAQCRPGPSKTGASEQPMQLFAQLLEEVAEQCRQGGPAMVQRLLGKRGPVLAPFIPCLRPFVDSATAAPRLSAEAGREVLFQAIFDTLVTLFGYRPTLLVLDDLQWIDALSARCLRYFVENQLGDYPWLVLGMARNERSPHLKDLMSDPGMERLYVEPLGEEHIGPIIEDMLGLGQPPAQLKRFIAQRCRGNPFFVGEYLKLLLDEQLLVRNRAGSWVLHGRAMETDLNELPLPESVQDVIDTRIENMEKGERSVVALVAVIGSKVPLSILLPLSSMERKTFERSLEGLIQRGILTITQGEIHFAHATVRERTYQRMDARQRADLHSRIALWMERTDGDLSEIAYHWARASNPVRARKAFLQAARRAIDQYDPERASALFEEALERFDNDSIESLQLRCAFAQELLKSGERLQDAARLLSTTVADTRRLGAPDVQIQALLLLGEVCFIGGQIDDANQNWTEALNLSRERADIHGQSYALMGLGSVFLRRGKLKNAQGCFSGARIGMVQTGDEAGQAELFTRLASLTLHKGRPSEARTMLETALELTTEAQDRDLRNRILTLKAEVAMVQGKTSDAHTALRQARRTYDGDNSPRLRARVLLRHGVVQCKQGVLDEAGRSMRMSIHLSQLVHAPLLEAQARLRHSEVMMIHGDLAEALLQAGQVQMQAQRYGDGLLELDARCVLGEGFTLDHRPGDAAPQFETAMHMAREVESAWTLARIHLAMARACVQANKLKTAIEWANKATDLAVQSELQEVEALSERLRARILRRQRRLPEAEQSLRRATTGAQTMGLRLLGALCLCEQGQLHLHWKQHKQALIILEKLHTFAKRLKIGPRSRLGQEIMELATPLSQAIAQGPSEDDGPDKDPKKRTPVR